MKISFVKTAFLAVMTLGTAIAQEPPAPPVPPVPPVPPRPPRVSHRADRDGYRAGQAALDRRQYDRAIEDFDRVIPEKSNRSEGALYWRAYALNKLGRRNEALASLAELQKTYPQSRWIEDAKALEVEVRQASGAPVSPDAVGDEEMKLLVLSNLMNSDPDRSIPVLEKLLHSTNSPKVKERALFVLAQSRSPKAREVIAQVAKGNYNPDLQAKAVQYLGVFGGRENAQTLADIYKSSNDLQVKRSILQSFMVSGSREALLSVAKTESNPELRTEAIHQLGVMGGAGDLLQLYSPDASPQIKQAILQGLFVGGQYDKILEIARTDKDPAMRRAAIRQIGPMGRVGKPGDLTAMYAKETDQATKREILNALFIQQNAPALIEVAKNEKDPNLKRDAVQKLSLVHSKEAQDFLLETLK
jgi:tetratricopeptide (TPR) repeat protein